MQRTSNIQRLSYFAIAIMAMGVLLLSNARADEVKTLACEKVDYDSQTLK